MPIKNTAGGKTFPKRGRLGTGAYFPGDQSNSDQIRGNPFGPNNEPTSTRTSSASPRAFGTRSNAGNATAPYDSRLTQNLGATHPNSGFRNISKQNTVMPISSNTGGRVESPFITAANPHPNPVVQPHERNQLHHRKARTTHHAAGGTTPLLPSDTAFQRNPTHDLPRAVRRVQQNVLREQFKPNGSPQSEGPSFSRSSKGQFVPSFISRNQLWTDPNNSYLEGASNPLGGGQGKGRWQITKRGAAG